MCSTVRHRNVNSTIPRNRRPSIGCTPTHARRTPRAVFYVCAKKTLRRGVCMCSDAITHPDKDRTTRRHGRACSSPSTTHNGIKDTTTITTTTTQDPFASDLPPPPIRQSSRRGVAARRRTRRARACAFYHVYDEDGLKPGRAGGCWEAAAPCACRFPVYMHPCVKETSHPNSPFVAPRAPGRGHARRPRAFFSVPAAVARQRAPRRRSAHSE